MSTCKYESDQFRCPEDVFNDSDYCVLHTDFPEDIESEEFTEINRLKEEKVKEKVKNKDFNFEGTKLLNVDFTSLVIKKDLKFDKSRIIEYAYFNFIKIGGDVSFDAADIGGDVSFDAADIGGDVSFDAADIGGDVSFDDADIGGDVSFDDAKIGRLASFINVKLNNLITFKKAKIGVAIFKAMNVGNAIFDKVNIGSGAGFDYAKITSVSFDYAKLGQYTHFIDAEITNVSFKYAEVIAGISFEKSKLGSAFFQDAKIRGSANFDKAKLQFDAYFFNAEIDSDVSFIDAEISKDVYFEKAEIGGILNFKNTKFIKPQCQEKNCRKAKIMRSELGDRDESDYYFYREMEAKRLQKDWYVKYPEWIVQKFFGYGVYPLRVILTWISIIIIFAIIYWHLNAIQPNSLLDYIYFSVTTAATPGYGGYTLTQGSSQRIFAIIEAILGTFMWAAIIATFARKYMGNQ